MLTHDGITFTWPDVLAGEPDNVVAMGQTVLVSGSGTTLGFLGASGHAADRRRLATGARTRRLGVEILRASIRPVRQKKQE